MQAETIKPAQANKPKRGTVNPQPLSVVGIDDALMSLRTLGTLADLSVPTLYRRAKTDPTFPELIHLGSRCTRVRAGSARVWLASLGGA